MRNNKVLGNYGEKLAVKYLIKNNYKILEQNYTCPLGEIDIIAEENGTIVIVEVKTRTSNLYSTPAEAVNYYKQHKLQQLALYYLRAKHKFDTPIRFDVIEVIGDDINHIINAF